MKLVIQIPCYNEQEVLPVTLAALPRSLPGVDEIEVLVINDGSTDRTVAVARELGVRHVLELGANRGLATAFMEGLQQALRMGADIVINLDADNQYDARDIPLVLAPLLARQADLVVGERPIGSIGHFSPVKKVLQRLGSWLVRMLSRTDVMDTTSGFRALNRKAMLSLFIFNRYTYTHESLIAARSMGLVVKGVPIRVNRGISRPSRLMKSTLEYVLRSAVTITRFYLIYNPHPILLGLSGLTGLLGLILAGLTLAVYSAGNPIVALGLGIAGVLLLVLAVLCLALTLLSDLLSAQRKLMQRILYEQREQAYGPADRQAGRGDE